MRSHRYLTDYQRYAFSGVVVLHQLSEHPHPDPFRDRDPRCIIEQKALQQRFRDEPWEPWLPENHLKAEVTDEMIANIDVIRDILVNGDLYPLLNIRPDAGISITEGIALLEVLRSTSFATKHHVLDVVAPGTRWCIVDFVGDGR